MPPPGTGTHKLDLLASVRLAGTRTSMGTRAGKGWEPWPFICIRFSRWQAHGDRAS